MKNKELEFKLEHLNRYAIISEPCTVMVRNNTRLQLDDIFTGDGHPRWVLNLKAISSENLAMVRCLIGTGEYLTYSEIGPLLMKGALWEEQIMQDSELPSKGEEVIAVFDYVEEILRCTNITLIPREQPRLFLYASDALDEISEFERIIQEANEKH